MSEVDKKIFDLTQKVERYHTLHMKAIDNKDKKIKRIMKTAKSLHADLTRLLKDFKQLDDYKGEIGEVSNSPYKLPDFIGTIRGAWDPTINF